MRRSFGVQRAVRTSSWISPRSSNSFNCLAVLRGGRSSGRVPNTCDSLPLISSVLGRGIKYCAWNARAFYCRDKKLRAQKLKEVRGLCDSFDVVGIVETHGSEILLREHLRCIKSHHPFISTLGGAGGKSNSVKGGIVILVDKRLLSADPQDPCFRSNVMFNVLVRGRVGRVELFADRTSTKRVGFTLAHNQDFCNHNMSVVESSVREDIRRSSASPSEFCGVLMGDINLVPDGESPIDLKRPISASAQTEFVPSPSRPFKARWLAILNSLAEVCAPYPTHLDIANLNLDRIDRTFTTAPRSMLSMLSILSRFRFAISDG